MKISNIAKLPSRFGFFLMKSYKENEKEHLALWTKDLDFNGIVNTRIHSECLTGDTFGSLKCDCGEQLKASLEYIAKNSGLLIYLRQEGRNIGLFNKINAYSLQDQGLNTIEANEHLGFKADERSYEIADFIFNDLKIKKINLLTNNPLKLNGLKSVQIVQRIALEIQPNEFDKDYLRIKKEQMGHKLNEFIK